MRTLTGLCALIVLAMTGLVSLSAQANDNDKILEALKDQAVILNIQTRHMDHGVVQMASDYTKVTVHGRPVSLKLEGEDVLVQMQFTPYLQGTGLMLLVQTQLWLQKKNEQKLQYFTYISSMAIEFGETLLFYPLGKLQDTSVAGSHIELELVARPYTAPSNLRPGASGNSGQRP